MWTKCGLLHSVLSVVKHSLHKHAEACCNYFAFPPKKGFWRCREGVIGERDIWSGYDRMAHFEIAVWPLLLESSKVATNYIFMAKDACKFCLQAWDLFFWVKPALSRLHS